MRILVTGASGFIGRRVIRRLLAIGHDVYAIRSGTQSGSSPLPIKARAISLNLFDAAATHACLQNLRPQRLVHLAWTTHPATYREDPNNHAWVRASLNLLHAFAQSGGQHAWLAGSCAEYDWRAGGCLRDGLTPLQPHTRYGRCKAALSLLATDYAQAHGIGLAWGRIAFPFGPREHPARLISSLIQGLLDGTSPSCGPGAVARDFIYVEDLVDMIMLLSERALTGIFDLGSGRATSVAELAHTLQALTRSPLPARLDVHPPRPGEPTRLWSDTTRICAAGWIERWGLHAGLSRCVAARRRLIQSASPPKPILTR